MPFSKKFPRQVPDSNYPVWEEIYLTEEEEREIEQQSQKEHFSILDDCINEAKTLVIKHGMNEPKNVTKLAIALFEKRASHVVFWKENKAKEKFDQRFKP
tara:strand:- start:355 stop:654 length:300 start_codon:yes stop_codon:yes gene_type:complete